VFHLDRSSRGIFQSNSKGVITNYSNTGELSGRCHGAVTGCSQEHVGVSLIVAFQYAGLACAGQSPHFATTFQNTGSFQLETGYLGQIPVEL
jgi:hypothetical protein